MSPDKQQALYDKYPELFERHILPATQTCMCWGITTGDGWYDIIDRLCQRITDHCSDNDIELPRFEQVKEKFGGLRVYFHESVGPVMIQFAVEAENASVQTCEETGRPGTLYLCGSWYRTLADDVAAKRNCKKRE